MGCIHVVAKSSQWIPMYEARLISTIAFTIRAACVRIAHRDGMLPIATATVAVTPELLALRRAAHQTHSHTLPLAAPSTCTVDHTVPLPRRRSGGGEVLAYGCNWGCDSAATIGRVSQATRACTGEGHSPLRKHAETWFHSPLHALFQLSRGRVALRRLCFITWFWYKSLCPRLHGCDAAIG
jgi:hypothetical protein